MQGNKVSKYCGCDAVAETKYLKNLKPLYFSNYDYELKGNYKPLLEVFGFELEVHHYLT
jgi:hypothetical protein